MENTENKSITFQQFEELLFTTYKKVRELFVLNIIRTTRVEVSKMSLMW